MNRRIEKLLKKGVRIPKPEAVEIGKEIDVDRISGDGVIIYAGSKILGGDTLILSDTRIGYQGPATVENCFIGPGVHLDGGYFKESVFLKDSHVGPGAHIREGTILEEGAGAAHTVGLKQTILFPFVTLGSLVNFCDCFMAGGTGRSNHSEVGSSYVHFNFTPHQDKATPSLLGDVPSGVMLDQRPIFLGGQGGLVGPCRLAFGTVTAAGVICRKDELRPDRLILGETGPGGSLPYAPGLSQNIVRTVRNNLIYLANLFALTAWYGEVRAMFISKDFPEALFSGLKKTLQAGISERSRQLKRYRDKIFQSLTNHTGSRPFNTVHREISDQWAVLHAYLEKQAGYRGNRAFRDAFLDAMLQTIEETGKDYLRTIKSLNDQEKKIGTRWLQGIVDDTLDGVSEILPSFDIKNTSEDN